MQALLVFSKMLKVWMLGQHLHFCSLSLLVYYMSSFPDSGRNQIYREFCFSKLNARASPWAFVHDSSYLSQAPDPSIETALKHMEQKQTENSWAMVQSKLFSSLGPFSARQVCLNRTKVFIKPQFANVKACLSAVQAGAQISRLFNGS